MSTSSAIEWTDASWQVTSGCSKVSEGCRSCYAETMAKRLQAMARGDEAAGRDPKGKRSYLNVINDRGQWNGRIELIPENLKIPLTWKKPRRVFVNSMSDLFHEGVPFDYVDRVFAIMAICPQHTFQVLTKRPERMAAYLSQVNQAGVVWRSAMEWGHSAAKGHGEPWPLPNVWLGTSVENQKTADERIPHLLRCPAVVRFLSVEPLLEAVDLGDDFWESGNRVEWVIVGGESGTGARPCSVEWIRSIIAQCKSADIPCFCKQLGAKPFLKVNPCVPPESLSAGLVRIDRERTESKMVDRIKDGKGGDMDEWPEDLKVRQFPATAEARRV